MKPRRSMTPSTSGSWRKPRPRGSTPPSSRPDERRLTMAVLDSVGMFELTASLPEQVQEAARHARGRPGLPRAEDIEHVVVLGRGGSGMAGDVVAAIASALLPVPVVVSKSYECPVFVGDSTLVFA